MFFFASLTLVVQVVLKSRSRCRWMFIDKEGVGKELRESFGLGGCHEPSRANPHGPNHVSYCIVGGGTLSSFYLDF